MLKKIFMITLFPFVGKNGVVKPNRVFITIILSIIIKILWMKSEGTLNLSDNFVIGIMTFASSLIAADTWRSNSKGKHEKNVE